MATYAKGKQPPQPPPSDDWFEQQQGDPAAWTGPGAITHYGQPAQAAGVNEPFTLERMYQIMSKYPATNEGFRQGIAEAQSIFGKDALELLEHPQRLDKFRTKSGEVYDIMYAAGDPAAKWRDLSTWQNEAGMPHGGGGSSVGFMAGKDPSYDFVMKEGMKALQNVAAAKGTLMTGGFAKDAMAYASGLASGEFQNIWGRNMDLARLGMGAAQTAGQFGSSYGNNAGNLITGRGNAQAAGSIARGNANRDLVTSIGNIAGGAIANRRPRPYNQPRSTYSGPPMSPYGYPTGSEREF